MPRVFDTTNPVEGDCGDPDLGSPNMRCDGGGPGKGEDGEPDGNGPNCSPLGNVLIIQEPGEDCPDDNVDGGMMTFDFEPMAEYVKDIGLLDVDYSTTISITFMNEDGDMDVKTMAVPELGDNSYQLLSIDASQVKQLKISMERSVGVSSLTYCIPPSPTPPPTPATDICTEVDIDFSVSADNTPISRGDYVSDDWAGVGLVLSASGGLGDVPRIFDTSNPGDELFGDIDLGSPNEKCEGGGPGKGKGGVPSAPGANCVPLGNALIIQEVNDNPNVPDDNVDGGKITLEFPDEAKYVYEMGLLDIDYAATLTVYHRTDEGVTKTVFNLQLLGDNAAQVQEINIENVQKMVLNLSRSGAITYLSYCVTTPPSEAPSSSPSESPSETVRT
jgi:hypothetical protein